MTYKTKKPSGKLGLMRNLKQGDDSLQRRARLTQSLKDAFNAGQIANTQAHLLHYGTKEAQFGNLSCWDFENTQIPYSALNID